ncbi:MAG: alanine--glyoxylate aminotransferase family protein [Flammeovirgaceae bacterium]
MKKYYLTPGPSEIYFTVPDHLKEALNKNIPSISHRGKTFQEMCRFTIEQVRNLLNVPTDFHIVFTGSATEVWERVIQNCVENHSYHLVNGSFSKRFKEFGDMLGKKTTVYEVPFGEGFELDKIQVPQDAELICITQNETSSGVCVPVEDIAEIRKRYPHQLIVVDAVSAVPYPSFNFRHIDSLFFSVQKGMGLPAGLGVWIFNNRCLEKAESLKKKGLTIGTYHTIPSLVKNIQKFETPETPNVLGIYLLGKVAEDMNRKGIEEIRKETYFKAGITYQFFEESELFEPLVKNKAHRSQTVLVANVKSGEASGVLKKWEEKGLIVGKGYGDFKDSQIRVANFPTFSKEVFYQLIDTFQKK